ncbi:MAG: 3-carboxy-cis,cis-muconate cycloisomerase [Actinobacteria bacterium]|nr:3-carboxy-cis,cis-muconate cycloisomerase [Actinomycetota bacterium]
MSEPDQNDNRRGVLFGGVFGHSQVEAGDAAWLRAMLDTEAALARAAERAGLVPAGAGAAVTAAAEPGRFDLAELGELSALTGNPVPGLSRALARQVPGPLAGAVHKGATSQDIIDTAAMVLAQRALAVIGADLAAAAAAAASLAAGHRDTVMIGRTLLQQAVPTTFGLVAAGWLNGLDEARAALARTGRERLAVQFGGAAGTLAALGDHGPRVLALLAEELDLPAPPLPWHTIRLRVLELAAALAGVDSVLSKIARDVTLLAQTEVGEVREGPGGSAGAGRPRRGGSSAMPNKQNPVAAIAILGCVKQAPGLLATLAATGEQELQRAAGAWHAEWQPLTDLLTLTGSAASWAADLLGGLIVDPARMSANLNAAGGLPLAERVTALLAGSLGRAAAHDLVAEAGARAVSAGLPLRDVLLGRPQSAEPLEAAGITAEQVDAALDPANYLGAAAAFADAALAAHERSTGRTT